MYADFELGRIKMNGIIKKGIQFVDEKGYLDKARNILEVVGNLRLVGED